MTTPHITEVLPENVEKSTFGSVDGVDTLTVYLYGPVTPTISQWANEVVDFFEPGAPIRYVNLISPATTIFSSKITSYKIIYESLPGGGETTRLKIFYTGSLTPTMVQQAQQIAASRNITEPIDYEQIPQHLPSYTK